MEVFFMSKLSDAIYINTYFDEKRIIYYGIEFKDFISSLDKPLSNVLLIKHDFYGDDFHPVCRFEYVKNNDLIKLINADVNKYGDFCWVDFETEKSLDFLEPQEVAELLFFGHLGNPLKSPFFEKLNNRYAYWSHDDGWYNELYSQNIYEFAPVIANAILLRNAKLESEKVNFLNEEVSKKLLELSGDGLLLDFSKGIVNDKNINIPIYTIGKLLDMDDMYNNLDKYKNKALFKAWLCFENKRWIIKN